MHRSSILLESTSCMINVLKADAEHFLVFKRINIPVASHNDSGTISSDGAPNHDVGQKFHRCLDVFCLQSAANIPPNIKMSVQIKLQLALVGKMTFSHLSIDHLNRPRHH